MILFDSHAHYYDEKFGDGISRAAVIEKIRTAGVKYVLKAEPIQETSSAGRLRLPRRMKAFFAR